MSIQLNVEHVVTSQHYFVINYLFKTSLGIFWSLDCLTMKINVVILWKTVYQFVVMLQRHSTLYRLEGQKYVIFLFSTLLLLQWCCQPLILSPSIFISSFSLLFLSLTLCLVLFNSVSSFVSWQIFFLESLPHFFSLSSLCLSLVVSLSVYNHPFAKIYQSLFYKHDKIHYISDHSLRMHVNQSNEKQQFVWKWYAQEIFKPV